jgi:DNA-binding transcriptional LysR family regulator
MKIDQLIYFNETAKLEHIGKASKILGISTSAISHSIASLEGELGYKLFEKKGKNIVLTDQGRKLLEQSQDLINQFQNLKQNLLGSHQEKKLFKIAASHRLAHEIIVPVWTKISPSFPNVTLEIMTYRSAEVVRSILNREIDLGICFSPQANPDLQITPVYNGELLISLRKSHPVFKMTEKKQLLCISDYPAVLPKAFQGIELCISHPMFEKYAINPKAKTLTDSYDISLEIIKKSDAWGFTPDIFVKKRKSEYNFIKPPKEWDAPFSISVIHLNKKFIPNFFHEFISELSKQLSS